MGARLVTRAAKLTDDAAAKQLAHATAGTEQQFVDGAEDLLVDAEQPLQVVSKSKMMKLMMLSILRALIAVC